MSQTSQHYNTRMISADGMPDPTTGNFIVVHADDFEKLMRRIDRQVCDRLGCLINYRMHRFTMGGVKLVAIASADEAFYFGFAEKQLLNKQVANVFLASGTNLQRACNLQGLEQQVPTLMNTREAWKAADKQSRKR